MNYPCLSCRAGVQWQHCDRCTDLMILEAKANGAAVAFGLMGMAEAIRRGPAWVTRCGFHSPPYCGGPCMVCGYDDGTRRSEDGETWTRTTPDRSVDHG